MVGVVSGVEVGVEVGCDSGPQASRVVRAITAAKSIAHLFMYPLPSPFQVNCFRQFKKPKDALEAGFPEMSRHDLLVPTVPFHPSRTIRHIWLTILTQVDGEIIAELAYSIQRLHDICQAGLEC